MALQCLEIQISSRKILSSKDDILGTPVMSSGLESTTELKEIQMLPFVIAEYNLDWYTHPKT